MHILYRISTNKLDINGSNINKGNRKDSVHVAPFVENVSHFFKELVFAVALAFFPLIEEGLAEGVVLAKGQKVDQVVSQGPGMGPDTG